MQHRVDPAPARPMDRHLREWRQRGWSGAQEELQHRRLVPVADCGPGVGVEPRAQVGTRAPRRAAGRSRSTAAPCRPRSGRGTGDRRPPRAASRRRRHAGVLAKRTMSSARCAWRRRVARGTALLELGRWASACIEAPVTDLCAHLPGRPAASRPGSPPIAGPRGRAASRGLPVTGRRRPVLVTGSRMAPGRPMHSHGAVVPRRLADPGRPVRPRARLPGDRPGPGRRALGDVPGRQSAGTGGATRPAPGRARPTRPDAARRRRAAPPRNVAVRWLRPSCVCGYTPHTRHGTG